MSKDELELKRACKDNDVARVHELFTTRSLDHEDATSCTYEMFNLPLMRCLLEHGADLRWYLVKHAPPSLNVIKLFVEFGFDVEAGGHTILQDFAHDQGALDWLINCGADVNRTDGNREDESVDDRTGGWHNFSLEHCITVSVV